MNTGSSAAETEVSALTNQKKPPSSDPPVIFGMTDYFKKGVLPLAVTGAVKTISKDTPRIQNEDGMMLLIHSGTGTIFVNHEKYKLRRGSIFCMGPFHNYSISPDPGSAIEYSEAHINSGAYMYLLSCPYLKVSRMLVPSPPAVACLSEKDMVQAELTMTGIRENADNSYYKNKLDYLYMMELYGILMSKMHDTSPLHVTQELSADHPGQSPAGAEKSSANDKK